MSTVAIIVNNIFLTNKNWFPALRAVMTRFVWFVIRTLTVMSIVGSVVGAALCFVMFMRKDD